MSPIDHLAGTEPEQKSIAALLRRMADLHKTAVEEKSHNYTGKVLLDAMAAITSLHAESAERQLVIDGLQSIINQAKANGGSVYNGDLKTTEPPPAWRRHRQHWLHAQRGIAPAVVEWENGAWFCVGENEPTLPAEMYRRGWEWLAPAIPPRLPGHDD